MSRKDELKECRSLMANLNTITILAAEAFGSSSAHNAVEPCELDEIVGKVYAQAVDELRQAVRTLSVVEEHLEPAVKRRQLFGGFFGIFRRNS